MNELLARAGSIFLAPALAPAAVDAPVEAAKPADLVGVLAPPDDLPVVAGGIAARLRRGRRARSAVICSPSPMRAAGPCTRPARALARRLSERELDAVPVGALCAVRLPPDPELGVRATWRVAAVAAGNPIVLALSQRAGPYDSLLAHADRLMLAVGSDADLAYEALALESLAALGPAASRARTPHSLIGRRLAALGLAGVAVEPEAVLA